MTHLARLKKDFQNPPSEYRSVPFWAWNDRLSPEEISRQVKEMKAKGMGGFFMHSREGLETAYMGPEWMKCVKKAVETAREEGMGAWLYDEDRWPSGAAGGLVPAAGGDAFRAKGLTVEISRDACRDDPTVAVVFHASTDGDSLRKCSRVTGESPVREKDEVFLVFRKEVSGPCEWFNNDTPPDNLNPEAVKTFIALTYEAYKKMVGKEFGRTVPGIFSDEPNVADFRCIFKRGWIPWTDGFPEYFQQKRGYDIWDYVPYIFFDGKKSAKIRHDYRRTICERFCAAYSQQIGEWCGKNNLAFTGHYLWENELTSAAEAAGAVMPHYRYQHLPGIDMLREQTGETITVKQCTSVARQYGRKRVLSETYGCTGWDFTFEGQKWVGDWQFVMGVNLRCQHLALYTLKGCRKRDYPPAFNYNTCWWKYNNVVEDYFARLAAVLTHGEAVRDLLILHPCSSVWSILGAARSVKDNQNAPGLMEAKEFGRQFNDFLRFVLACHYDFDLGDEIIMEEEGRVENGKLWIKLAGYRVAIIPPVKTLFKNTVKLLVEFMNAGGKVIAVTPQASMIEGGPATELNTLYSHPNLRAAEDKNTVRKLLEELLPRKVSLCNRYGLEAPELLYMLRELPGGFHLLFVVNNDRRNPCNAVISLDGTGKVEEWDPLTGATEDVKTTNAKKKTVFTADFGPAGSRLFVLYQDSHRLQPKKPAKKLPGKKSKFLTALGPACAFTRTMPNALTLDRCRYRFENSGWSGEMEVWRAQNRVREILGMRQVYYNGLPQRYKWVDRPHPGDDTPVSFLFTFTAAVPPEKEARLALETARLYRVTLNGKHVDTTPQGWFMDRNFNLISLPALQQGRNDLVISCNYCHNMEFEEVYLTGDFAVDTRRVITREPALLRFGDWGLQGYFHYCGSMIYHFPFHYADKYGRIILEMGDYRAVTVEVRVNNETAGHVPWRAAGRIDLTRLLREGENQIDLEVMGSPRNLFGPFHQTDPGHSWTGWRSFRREGREYTPEYITVPYGLLERIKLYHYPDR